MRANNVAGQFRRWWLASLALVWALNLGAQPYILDWYAISAGGGQSASADGRYEVTDTMGQPEAGPSSSAAYDLEAGFIPGLSWQPLVNYGPTTWGPDGSYDWQMNRADGAAGYDPGWSLAVIDGDLDIQATVGQPLVIHMETLHGEAPGLASRFDYRNDYSWPMATVSGNILGFDATKFVFDASRFSNFLGGGSFRMQRSGNTLSVAFDHHACLVSETTLGWTPTGADLQLFYTNQFGLSGVEGITLRNCTLRGTAYGPGLGGGVAVGTILLSNRLDLPLGTTNLTLVAVKTDAGAVATVNARVYDGCGNGRQFDPVMEQLTIPESGVIRRVYTGLSAAEHYVGVVNGKPGLSRVKVVVNGHAFEVAPLEESRTVVLDVRAAMNEGDQNTVVFFGFGLVGATADIHLFDRASGSPLTLAAIIEPPALRITRADGRVVLAWEAPANFFTLEASESLSPQALWREIPAPQEEVEGITTVTLPIQGGMTLFHLRQATVTYP